MGQASSHGLALKVYCRCFTRWLSWLLQRYVPLWVLSDDLCWNGNFLGFKVIRVLPTPVLSSIIPDLRGPLSLVWQQTEEESRLCQGSGHVKELVLFIWCFRNLYGRSDGLIFDGEGRDFLLLLLLKFWYI